MSVRPPFASLVFLSLALGTVKAQQDELSEARGYLAQQACAEVSDAARRSIAAAPSAEAWYILGHCGLRAGEPDSARAWLERALALDSSWAEAEYDLGLAHQELGDADGALEHLRRFSGMQPDARKGRTAEAYVLLDLKEDPGAAEAVLKGVLEKDPTDAVAQYYMAVSLHHLGREEDALRWARQGEQDHPDDADFPALQGSWAQREGDYTTAAQSWGRAFNLTHRTSHGQRAGYCRVMARTDTALYRRDADGRVRFRSFGARHMEDMDVALSVVDGPYAPASLASRWRDDPGSMGLDAVYMNYYAQHVAEEYAPYGDDAQRVLGPLLEEDRYPQLLAAADHHLETHPTCLEALKCAAIASRELAMHDRFEQDILRYEALMQAILATGSGTSADEAIVVMNVHDEYVLLGFNGLRVKQQALLMDNGHSLDRMSCVDEEGMEETVHFEISKPFASLGRMMDGAGKEKKRKRK